MKRPAIPENERQRQLELEQYRILDSLPEKAYDDITLIAAQLCQTPVATITFIDGNRQQFKSKIGLSSNSDPRDYSFCAHAINHPGEILEISDAREHEDFRDNPLVTGAPWIVFYAGMPIVNIAGLALGTLCVIDHKPRKLDTQQRAALKSLAAQVMQLLDLRLKNLELVASEAKLAAYAEQMRDFASIASHDMKEPLRMIRSFTQILNKEYRNLLDDRGSKYIQLAHDGAVRMTALIDELLTYASTSAGNQPIEQIEMTVLMEEVKALLKNTLDDKKAALEYGRLPTVRGYRTAMRTLFQNLVSNAVKYQSGDLRPVVLIHGRDTDKFWEFCVEDNGIGLEETNAQNIFEPFTRLDNSSRFEGTGLGLAICKNICTRHGGKIRVESKIDGGSRFYVTFSKQIPAGHA